jgi:DNA-binding winged helix-turn-helix (wHTH) protein
VILAFGDCELDEELYALRRRRRPVKLEPKVFDVLLFLVRHRARVVTKEELLDALWPGEARGLAARHGS